MAGDPFAPEVIWRGGQPYYRWYGTPHSTAYPTAYMCKCEDHYSVVPQQAATYSPPEPTKEEKRAANREALDRLLFEMGKPNRRERRKRAAELRKRVTA
jgi:hypothetical protein